MFCSTRDRNTSKSFKDVTLSGYAEDGGLYVPKTVPQLSIEILLEWQSLNYIEIVKNIIALYVDDISREKLGEIIDKSFNHFIRDQQNEVLPLVWIFSENLCKE